MNTLLLLLLLLLQHTNVKCTWDEGEKDRESILTNISQWRQLNESELMQYIASSDSDDNEDDNDVESDNNNEEDDDNNNNINDDSAEEDSSNKNKRNKRYSSLYMNEFTYPPP